MLHYKCVEHGALIIDVLALARMNVCSVGGEKGERDYADAGEKSEEARREKKRRHFLCGEWRPKKNRAKTEVKIARFSHITGCIVLS